MANKPAKLGNKKSPKKEGESATENKKSEGTVLDADGVLSMKVSKQHGTPFYIRSALSFLKGQGEDKPAVPKLRISALGNAISCAIACASRIEEAKMGKLESCQTTYCEEKSPLPILKRTLVILDLRTQTQLRPELQAMCHAVSHFRLPPAMRKMHDFPTTPASTTVGIFCVEGF